MPSKPARTARARRKAFLRFSSRALLAPAGIGISLATAPLAHAQTTISADLNSTYLLDSSTTSLTVNPGVQVISASGAGIEGDATSAVGLSLINHGTISGFAGGVNLTNAATVVNDGLISGTSGVTLTGGGSLANTGLIQGGSGNAILLNGGTITNGPAGSIGTGTIQSVFNTAIQSAANPAYITNYGTILSATQGAIALDAGGTVTNYGAIQAGSASLAAVSFGATGGTLKLETGSSELGNLVGGGNGVLVLEGTNTLGNSASGWSNLTMAGTDWTLTGNISATNTEVQAGTLRVNGMLTSGATQVDTGATLAGTGFVAGDVTAQSGAVVMPGDGSTPGSLSIAGNYTQQSGATLTILTTPASASLLNVIGGSATLGGVLLVKSTGTYTHPSNYIILTASGGIAGTFSSVTDTNAGLVASLTYDTANSCVILLLDKQATWTTGDNNVTFNSDITDPQDGLTGNDTLNIIDNAKVTANLSNIDTLNIGDLTSTVSQVSLDAGAQTVGATHIFPNATLILNGGRFATDSLDLAGGTLASNVDYTLGAPVTLSASSEINTASGRTLTLSGDVSGAGQLLKTGPGMLILNGANTYGGGTRVTAGTLEVGDADHAGAQVQGFVRVDNTGTLRGHGTVAGNVVNEGIVWPGGSIGTLTVDGDYMQSSNGTLMVDVSPDSASQLKVTGTASLAGGLSLLYGPGTYHSTTYRLVDAGAIEGRFASVTGNTPAGFAQSVTTSAKTVDLTLADGDTADTGGGDGATVVAPTNATIFGAIGASALREGQRTADTLLGRLARPCVANATENCERPAYQGWVRATSDTTHQHGNNGAPGNTDERYGLLVGADHNMGPWTVGVAAGYSHGDVREGTDASGKIDTLRVATYGSRQLGAVNVAGMIGGAYDFISSRRNFGDLGTARGTDDGQEAQAGLQASLPLRAGPTVITPRVGLRYQYFHGNAFGERGLDSQSLSVGSQDLHSLQPYVGITADYGFNGLGAKPAHLQGRIAYAYETLDTSRAVSVTSADGTGFSVPGATPSRGMFTAGLSLSMQVGKQWDVAASYDTLFRTGNTSGQTFRLNAAYRF